MSSFSYFVGQRIKKYRKSRGYTIEQFSAMINKSKATLSKYENGAITIDIETLYDIAQALDIDLKCFIDYQPPVFHQDAALPKNNYFNQSLAYMYYYDGRVRQMVRSLLRFSRAADREGIEVTLYLGVTSFSDPDRCQHLFTGEMKAYDTFICKLCEMARNQSRVNSSEKPIENEKYAFRCFLLRLGFIGAEYKTARKILLKNLSGSSAFRNGGAQHEISE